MRIYIIFIILLLIPFNSLATLNQSNYIFNTPDSISINQGSSYNLSVNFLKDNTPVETAEFKMDLMNYNFEFAKLSNGTYILYFPSNLTRDIVGGNHSVVLSAIDTDTNSVINKMLLIKIISNDIIKPIINVIGPENNTKLGSNQLFLNFTINDNKRWYSLIVTIGGYEILHLINNGTSYQLPGINVSNTSIIYNRALNLADIPLYANNIKIIAKDYGNNIAQAILYVKFDISAPEITWAYGDNTAFYSTDFEIIWSVNDDSNIISQKLTLTINDNIRTYNIPVDTTSFNLHINTTSKTVILVDLEISDEYGNVAKSSITLIYNTPTDNTSPFETLLPYLLVLLAIIFLISDIIILYKLFKKRETSWSGELFHPPLLFILAIIAWENEKQLLPATEYIFLKEEEWNKLTENELSGKLKEKQLLNIIDHYIQTITTEIVEKYDISSETFSLIDTYLQFWKIQLSRKAKKFTSVIPQPPFSEIKSYLESEKIYEGFESEMSVLYSKWNNLQNHFNKMGKKLTYGDVLANAGDLVSEIMITFIRNKNLSRENKDNIVNIILSWYTNLINP